MLRCDAVFLHNVYKCHEFFSFFLKWEHQIIDYHKIQIWIYGLPWRIESIHVIIALRIVVVHRRVECVNVNTRKITIVYYI